MAIQLAIEPERAQRSLIGYPSLDRARPVNLHVRRCPMTEISPEQAMYAQAKALYLTGQIAKARQVLIRTVREFPESESSHFLLGQTYFFSRKPDLANAIKHFGRVVQLSPSRSEGHHWLGLALDLTGDARGAERCYRRAIRLDSTDSRPVLALGHLLAKRGDANSGLRYLRKALSMGVSSVAADTYVSIGELLLREGKTQAAIRALETALNVEPGYPSGDGPKRRARALLRNHQLAFKAAPNKRVQRSARSGD